MEVEFNKQNIPYEREKSIPVYYKGKVLNTEYRADFICFNGEVIIELKAIKIITRIEEAQIMNYLKAANVEIGML